MRANLIGVLSLAAAVAACDRTREPEPQADPAETAAEARAEAVADAAESAAEADFIGVWAPTAEACGRNETWRFSPERLATPGGVSCAIEGAARARSGWSLQATCTGAGAPAPAELSLATAGSPPSSTLTVQGGPFRTPQPLVRCTPPLSAAPQ